MRKTFGAGTLLLTAMVAGSLCEISAQSVAPASNQADSGYSSSRGKSHQQTTATELAKSESSEAPAIAAASPATAAPATANAAPPSGNAAPTAGNAAPAPDTKVLSATTPKPPAKDGPDDSYIVGIADDLQISVWKEPDLSGPVVVRPDGMITLPVINDVYVVGLTTKQVQDILTEKLKPVVDEPQVTVIVRNIHSRRVYLVGQVGHPGSVSLAGHETVLQILAESGGPSIYAKQDKIYILRQMDGHQERLNFNYKKALKGNDPKADFPLVNGDVIVVP